MTFEEKTINSEIIYRGKIINLRKDTVTAVNGESQREVIEHNGGAVIIAVKDNGNIIMVRQFRKPAEQVMLEVPAGKIEGDEDPALTAERELKEETGYSAERVKFLTKVYPSVGYSQEILYFYLCTGLTPGQPEFDDNEAIDIEEYTIKELYSMAMSGRILDGKSQIAILMVKGLLEEGRLPICWKQLE